MCFERMYDLLRRAWARLSKMVWCSHCYTLAQARQVSLSEADGLAWVRVPGLSKNVGNFMFMCALLSWFVAIS